MNKLELNWIGKHDKENQINPEPRILIENKEYSYGINTNEETTDNMLIHGDNLLALKGNQGTLHEDVRLYFNDPELLSKCAYTKTIEKARNGIEKREYWHTDNISWLTQKKDRAGLKSIAMTKNTITKNGKVTTEVRFFISSLSLDIEKIAQAIRGHCMVESYHWHLDVTFGEDANRTIEKDAAYNLNIIRKIAINILKLLDVGRKNVSLKGKRFKISLNVEKYLELIMAI